MTVTSLTASTWSEAQAGARAFIPVSEPSRLLGGLLAGADLAVVVTTSLGAFLLRHGPNLPPEQIAATTLLALALTSNVLWLSGCYSRHLLEPPIRQIARAARGWVLVMVLLLLSAYLTKTSEEYSRVWASTWFVAGVLGFAVVRLGAATKVKQWRHRGKLARTVAVVDLTGSGEDVARRLLHGSTGEMRLVGVFGPDRTGERKNSVADLITLARLFRIDEVVVTVSGRDAVGIEAVVRRLGVIPANVRLYPDMPSLAWARRDAGVLFGEPMLTIFHRPLTGWNCIAKRVEDIVLSTVLLVLLSPVLAAVAVLIKLDSPGPVFFKQKRSGFNNNTINVYKFRSMTHLTALEANVRQAQRNDPRVTRVGRILRRTSIDELPQLLNVLQGNMSLVGPRPHAIAHNDQYAALIDGYLSRHRVQPGITGWAQVNGLRGETEVLEKMQRRVEFDLAYIESWSLSLDVRILIQTVLMTFLDRNAY